VVRDGEYRAQQNAGKPIYASRGGGKVKSIAGFKLGVERLKGFKNGGQGLYQGDPTSQHVWQRLGCSNLESGRTNSEKKRIKTRSGEKRGRTGGMWRESCLEEKRQGWKKGEKR